MTLEDFFTLTEMRDGLSSLARVEELVSMIQKLNGCAPSNMGDAVRQWSTVAGVLTATDHKECLNQFVELNGLYFLNKWLQEALNIGTVDSGIVVEELIHSLLTSFERLPIDYKRITASGTAATIELLLDHKSIPIKEKAKILYDRWNHARNDDMNWQDPDKSGAKKSDQPGISEDMQPSENYSAVIPPRLTVTDEGKREEELTGTELQVSSTIICSDSSAFDSTNKERLPTSESVLPTSLNPINSHPVLCDENSSESFHVLTSFEEKLSVTEEASVCHAEGKPSAGTYSQFCQEEVAADKCDASTKKDEHNTVEDFDKDMNETKSNKSNQRETGSNCSFFTTTRTTLVDATGPTISCKFDSDNCDPCASRVTEPEGLDGAVNSEQEKCLVNKDSIADANPSAGQDLSCAASILSNTGDQISGQKDEAMSSVGIVIKDFDHKANFRSQKSRFSPSTDFLKAVEPKIKEDTNKKSVLGLECMDDALEVARQVAIAVEKEVVDYREPFCSSPEGNLREISPSHSPDSEEEKQDQPATEDTANSSSGNDHSGTSSPEKESDITQNVSTDPEISDLDIESPKPKVPALESTGKSIDGCAFDLNTDIYSEEPECSIKPFLNMALNVSAPIAIVAASKGTPGLPVPLHFEGEMGWKGSAATSAFRRASSLRTPEGESTCSGSKQKSVFLEIDLNVAEVPDEPTSAKLLPASSSLPSGDSCVEIGSKTEKLNLDLNRVGDEDASAFPFSSWNLHFHNGERSLSSASSSSYNRQPSLRDFDLNDNPSFSDIGGSHNSGKLSSKAYESSGWPTPYEPVVKILGSDISVERKDNINQIQPFLLSNGLNMEPTMVTRPFLPCTNMSTPAYGYAGFPTGPSVSVPTAYYPPGSISYMADPRGAPVMPHVAGPGFGMPSGRPPFLLGSSNMPFMAGFGSSRPGFDLNHGLASAEGIRGGSFEQFFLQGSRGWMEDQTKTGAETSGSTKRKEPDSGWEPSLFGPKKMTSGQ